MLPMPYTSSKSKTELDWLYEEDVPSHLVEEFVKFDLPWVLRFF